MKNIFFCILVSVWPKLREDLKGREIKTFGWEQLKVREGQ